MGSKAELRHGKAAPCLKKDCFSKSAPIASKARVQRLHAQKYALPSTRLNKTFILFNRVSRSYEALPFTWRRLYAADARCMSSAWSSARAVLFFSARNSLHGPHAESEDLCGGVLLSHYTILPGGAQAPPGRILFNFFVCLFPLNPSCSAERP